MEKKTRSKYVLVIDFSVCFLSSKLGAFVYWKIYIAQKILCKFVFSEKDVLPVFHGFFFCKHLYCNHFVTFSVVDKELTFFTSYKNCFVLKNFKVRPFFKAKQASSLCYETTNNRFILIDLFKININTHDILYLKMKISYIMQFLKNKNK